jgi:hypothetical protein
MTTRLLKRGLGLLLLGLFLTGCESRGQFGQDACSNNERTPVGGTAVLAVYYDQNGVEVGTDGEALKGTTDNTMCPAPPPPGPGPCPTGKCPVTISSGKTYCIPC